MIREILDKEEKKRISRKILEALPNWFGIKEAREEYISDCESQYFFAAEKDREAIGFLCLKQTGKDTVEVSVMGIFIRISPTGNRKGIICTRKTICTGKRILFYAG